MPSNNTASTSANFTPSGVLDVLKGGMAAALKSVRRKWNNDQKLEAVTDVTYTALLVVAFLTTSAGMTGIITYTNGTNVVMAAPLAILIAGGLFLAMNWAVQFARSYAPVPARLAALCLYLLTASISVMFANSWWWTILVSQEYTQDVAQAQVSWVLQTADTADGKLQSMIDISKNMKAYSAETSDLEGRHGGTCGETTAIFGPRARLRAEDAAIFNQSAIYISGIAAPTRKAIQDLKTEMAVLQTAKFQGGSTALRAATVEKINGRISEVSRQVQRVSSDSNLGLATFQTRLKETQGPITRGGETFTCPDANLAGNLGGLIGAIQTLQALPPLADAQIEMAEGGKADWFAMQRTLNTVAAFFERRAHRPSSQRARQMVVEASSAGAVARAAPIAKGAGVITGKDWAPMYFAIFIDVAIGIIGFTKRRQIKAPPKDAGQYAYVIELLRTLVGETDGLFANLAPYVITLHGREYLIVPVDPRREGRSEAVRRAARLVANAAAVLVGLRLASEVSLWGPFRRRAFELLDANRGLVMVHPLKRRGLGGLIDRLFDRANKRRAHQYRFVRLNRHLLGELSFEDIANRA